MSQDKYTCGVPNSDHDGELHEWALGKPGMGTIILCDRHLPIYITKHTKPRPDPCLCCVCREKKTGVGSGPEELNLSTAGL